MGPGFVKKKNKNKKKNMEKGAKTKLKKYSYLDFHFWTWAELILQVLMKAPCIFCAVLDFLVTAEAKTDHRNGIKLATQNLFCI